MFESAYEHNEVIDHKQQRYFKTYSHNEPIDVASLKIEERLRRANPATLVVRHNDASFTMIHPHGNLITNVDTDRNFHHVGTHYISAKPEDFKLEMGEPIENGKKLYESPSTEYVLHDEEGNVYNSHDNPDVLNQSQKQLENENIKKEISNPLTKRHTFKISSRKDYEKQFSMNEGYRDVYTVHFTHLPKGENKIRYKSFKIDRAVDVEHAKTIAKNIALKRGLLSYKLKKVETNHN